METNGQLLISVSRGCISEMSQNNPHKIRQAEGLLKLMSRPDISFLDDQCLFFRTMLGSMVYRIERAVLLAAHSRMFCFSFAVLYNARHTLVIKYAAPYFIS
jgi:hypothetical protein